MIFTRTTFLLLSLMCSSLIFAQKLVFDAYLGDDLIGTMTVTRTPTDEGTIYTSVTDLTVRYLISVDLDLSYYAFYKGNQLHTTSFEYQRGHKTRESCRGELKNSTFSTYFDDRTEKVAIANIAQSLTAAYFAEPTADMEVFSERWGVNIPLVAVGNQQYKITLPDGKESIMTYANGQIRESRIISGWGDIVFTR
jgi:hypothetical protein